MRKVTSNVIKFVPHLLIKRAQERNLIAAKRVEAGLPGIGIFWAVPNQKGQPEILSTLSISHRRTTTVATRRPTKTTTTCGPRSNAWPAGGTTSEDFDYEYWPRGRINYNVEDDEFLLMADRQIINNQALLREVMKQFSLPASKTEVSFDGHYKSIGDLAQPTEPYQQDYLTLQTTYDDGETSTKEFTSDRRLRKFLEQTYPTMSSQQWFTIKQGQPVEMDGDILRISERGQRPLKRRL